MAELSFYFPHNEGWNQQVHVYFAESWQGQSTESEEMRPQWFATDQLPFSEMWPDDIFWLPLVLSDKKVKAKFVFGEGDVILEQQVEEVSEL